MLNYLLYGALPSLSCILTSFILIRIFSEYSIEEELKDFNGENLFWFMLSIIVWPVFIFILFILFLSELKVPNILFTIFNNIGRFLIKERNLFIRKPHELSSNKHSSNKHNSN